MLILGIDPGTATTGYGVVEASENDMKLVSYGLIETNKDGSPEVRLQSIHDQMLRVIKEFKPDIVAMEMLFFASNAKTAMRVGQACGVIMLSAAHSKIPLIEYAPGKIKKSVSGNGRADKIEMQKSVRSYLGAKVRKKKGQKTHFDNAADGLAVAICHVKEVIMNGEH